MNGTVRKLARAPIESRVATRAPHLVAPLDLADLDAAFRTTFGDLRQKLHREHLIRIAGVLGVATIPFDLVARRTRPDVAQPTFPRGAQEAFAVPLWRAKKSHFQASGKTRMKT